MAESKFAGLKELKNPKGQGPRVPKSAAEGALITPKERKLTGKRSDPDWKQRSVLIKNESFDEAHDILKRKYNGRDFSELVQALLDQWLNTEMAS
jgi:hypothetical protein